MTLFQNIVVEVSKDAKKKSKSRDPGNERG